MVAEDEQSDSPAKEDPEVNNSREPTLSDLAGILRAYMAQQKEQEAWRSKEADQQWQTIKDLQDQCCHLHKKLQAQPTPAPDKVEEAQRRRRPEPGRWQQQPIVWSRANADSREPRYEPDACEAEDEDEDEYNHYSR